MQLITVAASIDVYMMHWEKSTTVETQRKIQSEQDKIDEHKDESPEKASKPPVQTGEKNYPGFLLPTQHLKKPAHESEMELKPEFTASSYRGSEKQGRFSPILVNGICVLIETTRMKLIQMNKIPRC
jgi:hypothetical protein